MSFHFQIGNLDETQMSILWELTMQDKEGYFNRRRKAVVTNFPCYYMSYLCHPEFYAVLSLQGHCAPNLQVAWLCWNSMCYGQRILF